MFKNFKKAFSNVSGKLSKTILKTEIYSVFSIIFSINSFSILNMYYFLTKEKPFP